MNLNTERHLSALYQTIFIVLGNTFGIWFMYLVIQYLFSGIVPDVTWPGIQSFIDNGSFLIITFSILTTVILSTSINAKINWYNGIAFGLAVISAFCYSRCVGLNGTNVHWYTGLLPFLISIPLLFWSLKDQRNLFRKYSWLSSAKSKEFYYDIFLAFAIAGNKDKAQRDEIEKSVNELDELFKSLGYNNIFNASKYFKTEHFKQDPSEAAKEDFAGVENSKNFILFYPEKAPSSALMELGYALRDQRNILLISKSKHELPFLARGMSDVHENVRTIYFDDFNDLINQLKENHSKYLVK